MKIPIAANLAVTVSMAGILFSCWQGRRKISFQRFLRFYRDAAVILLNTVVLLVAVNRLLLILIV